MTEAPDFTRQLSMTLRDGRLLSYYEMGDPTGVPCIYTTGTPAAGALGLQFHDHARAAGIRWISIDKPGYGGSSFDPQRSLSRYAEDVRELADHLGIERFAAVGESGGGPHGYAVGRYLADRVTVLVALAGMGPGVESWTRKGMNRQAAPLFWSARYAPWLLSVLLGAFARKWHDPVKAAAELDKLLADAPAESRAALAADPQLAEMARRAFADAFPGGSTKAAAQELRMLAKPWEFRLEDVKVDVHMWHGMEDRNVPFAVAEHIARSLPSVTTHWLPGVGHNPNAGNESDIMAVIRAAAG